MPMPSPPVGRHAVAERANIILVHQVRLFVASLLLRELHFEAAPLLLRIVQLRVSVADLHAGRIDFEALHELRLIRLFLESGEVLDRIVVDDRGLEQCCSA